MQGGVNTLPTLAEVSTPALVSWSGFGTQYPLAVKTDIGALETPALVMYRQYCREHGCTDLPANAEAATRRPPMAVQWGLHRSPLQAQVSDVSNCTVPGLFDQLLQALFWKLGSSAQANCAYTLTLTARDLEVTDPDEQALLMQLLQGKQVLVGARIAGTGDITPSPLHGKIPGVYLHAMALDNLINWGMGYYRATPSLTELGVPFGSIDILDVIELALLGLLTYLKGTLDAPLMASSLNGRHALRLRPLSAWTVVILLLFGLSAGLWLNNYTPANVLGLLLLSMTLFSQRIQTLFEHDEPSRSHLISQGTQR
jgi:hypothetical protein